MGTPSQEYKYTAGSSEPHAGGADGNARLRIYLNEVLKGTYVPNGDDIDVYLECEGGGDEPVLPEIFNATYGTTTKAELDQALDDGKLIVCQKWDDTSFEMAVLSAHSDSYEFVWAAGDGSGEKWVCSINEQQETVWATTTYSGGGGGTVNITSSDNSVHITETSSGTDLSVDVKVNLENVSPIYFLPTMHPASTEQNVDPYYSGNGYYAHGTLMFLPDFVKIKPWVSSLITQITQGSLTNAYMAIYEYDDLGGSNTNNTVRLVARTDSFSSTTSAPHRLQKLISHCYDHSTGNEVQEILLDPDKMYYVVVFSPNQGARYLGRERGTQAQSVPYSALKKTNIQINNDALPTVLTPDGYVQSALYHVIRRGTPQASNQ